VRPGPYASIRGKGGRPKAAAVYSASLENARRHPTLQSEADLLEMQDEVVDGIIDPPQHGDLKLGNHREHPVYRGGPRELDEAPPVRMDTQREGGVDVDEHAIIISIPQHFPTLLDS